MPIIWKPIIPKPPNDKAMLEVLAAEVEKYKPFIKNDFEKTTAGWTRTKPNFVIKFNRSMTVMSLSVSVSGGDAAKIWYYLEGGTKPHEIRPKRSRLLRFPSGKYQAGSRPGQLNSYRSTPASGPDVFAKKVMHPGIAARGWLKMIRDAHERPFSDWMKAAMSRAAIASGHKI